MNKLLLLDVFVYAYGSLDDPNECMRLLTSIHFRIIFVFLWSIVFSFFSLNPTPIRLSVCVVSKIHSFYVIVSLCPLPLVVTEATTKKSEVNIVVRYRFDWPLVRCLRFIQIICTKHTTKWIYSRSADVRSQTHSSAHFNFKRALFVIDGHYLLLRSHFFFSLSLALYTFQFSSSIL